MLTENETMRIRIGALLAALAVLAIGGSARAQDAAGYDEEAMMKAWMEAAAPGEPHAFLAEMAGKWKTVVTQYQNGEAGEPTEGTAVFTPILGGRVVQGTYTGTMWGQPFEGMSLDGYDNMAKEYWSIWLDSMGTSFFASRGQKTGEATCELKGTMMTPMGFGVPMRFVATRDSDNETTFKSYATMPGSDEETLDMVIRYTRLD